VLLIRRGSVILAGLVAGPFVTSAFAWWVLSGTIRAIAAHPESTRRRPWAALSLIGASLRRMALSPRPTLAMKGRGPRVGVLGLVIPAALLGLFGCGGRTQPSCGSLQISARNGDQYFLRAREFAILKDCFLSGYERHTGASITLRQRGIDTRLSQAYRIRGPAVKLTTVVVYNAGPKMKSVTTCSKLGQRLGGILFTCNSGDILYSLDGTRDIANHF
jgi:hypothetical protein